MTEKIEDIYLWMEEITDIKPANFAEHFYSDIFNYVFPENYDDIANLADGDMLPGRMRKELLKCSSKKEVKNWMDDVAGNIIMNIDAEQIISEYLT